MSPVHAAAIVPGVDIDIDLVDFFEWWNGALIGGYNFIGSLILDDVCSGSSVLGGRHNFIQQRTTVNGKTGLYYVCEYCGKSAGEVAQQSYNDYVNTLPATGYDSSGQLCWRLNTDHYELNTGSSYSKGSVLYSSFGDSFTVSFGPNECKAEIYFSEFNAPVTGEHTLYFFAKRSDTNVGLSACGGSSYNGGSRFYYVSAPAYELSYIFYHYDCELDALYGGLYKFSYNAGITFLAGQKIISDSSSFSLYHGNVQSASTISGFWELRCIPSVFPGNPYSVNTRPTTITGGNYGIVGDNGQITKIEDNRTIINETNNTYYNPATGKTKTVNSWSYDYGDRSYTLTLGDGSTVTVTYGDQNITIVEGGNTYIVYYIVEGSVDTCTHEWYQTGHRQGNCLTPEQRTYTCSVCGKQYTETDPVLGHSWHIIQTVSTKYDDSGKLIQEGYTVYECERCGEQYKATNDTGPPPSGGGGSDGDSGDIDDGGLLEWINGLIQYLSDHLSGAVELILSFFRTIPELFGGFLDFLSAMFPFFPDEIMRLLTFGIAACILIWILVEVFYK